MEAFFKRSKLILFQMSANTASFSVSNVFAFCFIDALILKLPECVFAALILKVFRDKAVKQT